ncbi:TIM21-domain-containing protein [Hyaloraphidium curvatum]|nr:TIM21-domain-containing protein [Hyaloraphidium curvatum]
MPARPMIAARRPNVVFPGAAAAAPYPSVCVGCATASRPLAGPVLSRADPTRFAVARRDYGRGTWHDSSDNYKPPPGVNTMTRGERLVEASKTLVTAGFVVGGVLIMGGILYVIGSELTSDSSATKVYHDLLEQLRQHPEVEELIGLPLKGFHEHGTRARSVRRVNHQITEDGKKMFIRFYIEGSKARGAVNSEVHLSDDGKWEPYVLYFETPGDGLPSKRVFLVDKRPPIKQKQKQDKGRRRGSDRAPADHAPEPASGVGGSWLPKLGLFDRRRD